MKKVNWQYFADTLLSISVVGVVVIAFLFAFVIPRGRSGTSFLLSLKRGTCSEPGSS